MIVPIVRRAVGCALVGITALALSSCASAERSRPYPQALVSELAQLRSPDGLFHDPGARADQGTLHITYLTARLIPEDFASIAGSSTIGAVKDALAGDVLSAQARVEAVAVLRLAGDPSWQEEARASRPAIDAVVGSSVPQSELARTVAFIDAARVLDDDLARPRLEPFAASSPEDARDARLAISDADMFADGDTVETSFPTVTADLAAQAARPRDPAADWVTGLQAAAVSGAAPDAHSDAASALASLRGCPSFPDLYRASWSDPESCDLSVTRSAIDSGLAYQRP